MRTQLLYATVIASFGLLVHANSEPCMAHEPGGAMYLHEAQVAGEVAGAITGATGPVAKVVSPSTSSTAQEEKKSAEEKDKKSNKWSQKKTEKKSAPKVELPTKDSMTSGAMKVISKYLDDEYVPADVAKKLQQAMQKSIDAQVAKKEKTVTIHKPHEDEAMQAALDIKAALDDAFKAAEVSQSGLNAKTRKSLEKCLSTVLAAGGLPDGYNCLTTSGSDSEGLTETLNAILEQFVGILPNKILGDVFDSVMPHLSDLLPSDEVALVKQIQSSIESVIGTLSGSSVTAMQQMEKCYEKAIKEKGNSSALKCFTAAGGPQSTLENAMNGVIEQFVGVLPASLTTAVENIMKFNMQSGSTPNQKMAAKVSAQIANAINSVASTLSGNMVTLAEKLQACSAQLIETGDGAKAQKCLTSTGAPEVSTTMVLGIAEQFSGYLPSSFYSDLVDLSTPLLKSKSTNPKKLTQAKINSAFEKYFNRADYGPDFVTCLHQVEECVTNAIMETGKIGSICAGPQGKCAKIVTISSKKTKKSSPSKKKKSSRRSRQKRSAVAAAADSVVYAWQKIDWSKEEPTTDSIFDMPVSKSRHVMFPGRSRANKRRHSNHDLA